MNKTRTESSTLLPLAQTEYHGNEQILTGKRHNISKEDQEVTIAQPDGSEKRFHLSITLIRYKTDCSSNGKKWRYEPHQNGSYKDNGVKVWFWPYQYS